MHKDRDTPTERVKLEYVACSNAFVRSLILHDDATRLDQTHAATDCPIIHRRDQIPRGDEPRLRLYRLGSSSVNRNANEIVRAGVSRVENQRG